MKFWKNPGVHILLKIIAATVLCVVFGFVGYVLSLYVGLLIFGY